MRPAAGILDVCLIAVGQAHCPIESQKGLASKLHWQVGADEARRFANGAAGFHKFNPQKRAAAGALAVRAITWRRSGMSTCPPAGMPVRRSPGRDLRLSAFVVLF